MRNKHRNLLSAALVMLCIALLAGTAVLLLRTLPKKQPGTVETIQTGAVFDQTDNTAAPDREQAYDGELPNLSDTLEPDEAETPAPEDETALAAAKSIGEQSLPYHNSAPSQAASYREHRNNRNNEASRRHVSWRTLHDRTRQDEQQPEK